MENSHNISNLYSIIYLQIFEKRHFGAKSLGKMAQSPYICHRKKANIKYSPIIKTYTGAKTEKKKRKIDNYIKHNAQTARNALPVTAIKFLVDEGSYRYIFSSPLPCAESKDLRFKPAGDISGLYKN